MLAMLNIRYYPCVQPVTNHDTGLRSTVVDKPWTDELEICLAYW